MLLSLLVVGPLAALGFAAMPGQHASPSHNSPDHDHPVGDYIGCICGYGPLYISSDGALFHSDPAPVDLQVGDSVKYTATVWPSGMATYTAKVISIESGSLTGIEEGVTWYYIEYVDENGSTVRAKPSPTLKPSPSPTRKPSPSLPPTPSPSPSPTPHPRAPPPPPPP